MDSALSEYFVPIYGISCSNYERLGEFEIMSRGYFLQLIDKPIREKVERGESGNVFLGFNVSKSFSKGGGELARQKAGEFKKLMDFCCGRNNCIPAVNLQKIENSSFKYMHVNVDGSIHVHEEMNNNFIPREHSIEELKKEMESNKTLYVWELYSRESKSDKDNRLINAILWMGKAQTEVDNRLYFMELCFALESLLQVNTDVFINPSISYSISNACAMIIAENYTDRKTVFDNMKKLYGIRSAIAHGGKKEVKDESCEMLYRYIVYLISDIVNKEPWNKYLSMKDVMIEIEERGLGKMQ